MPVLPEILSGGRYTTQALVAANVALLLSPRVQTLVHEAGSYQRALFGETAESKPPENQGFINQREVLQDLGVFEKCYFDHANGGEFNFKTNRGYNDKARTPGASGYKHYLSLDLSSDAKLELGTMLYRELAERAIDAGVPFASKHWTAHAYDAQLIYTIGLEDTAKVAGMLKDIYPEYQGKDVMLPTPRLFQGTVAGINPDQVGWVREDLPGMPHHVAGLGMSHSKRLEELGRRIDLLGNPEAGADEHIGQVHAQLTPEVFITAALASRMHPARPYLTVLPESGN